MSALDPTPPIPARIQSVDRLSVRDRLILAVLLTASFTLAVDFSILNVALPVIGADVGFSLENLQWIATTFSLCAAGFTLLFGRVADLFGRRRLFLLGIGLLGASSLIGGMATAPWTLLLARVAQGIATAAVIPAALSLLTTSFPEGSLRDRALGLNGALMAAGFTTGAILGGLLTDLLDWRWAFYVNVAVAVVVLIVAPKVLVESRPARRPNLDVPGAVSVTLGLGSLVFGLTQAGESSWSNPGAWGSLSASAFLLAIFVAIEMHVEQPLVPLRVLRRPNVAWGNLAGLLAFATETSLVFLLTLYMQNVQGYSPLAAGVSFGVLGVGTIIGGMVAPKVIALVGSRNALIGGFIAQSAATLPLAILDVGGGWMVLLLAGTFVGGVANLIAIVGFMVTATSGLSDSEQGLATGLTTMSQQVGIALGIPVMSSIVASQVGGYNHLTPSTLLDGLSTAILVNGGLSLLAAVLVAAFLRPAQAGTKK